MANDTDKIDARATIAARKELERREASKAEHSPVTGDIVVSKRYLVVLKIALGILGPLSAAGVVGYLAQRDQDTRTVVAVKANTDAVQELTKAVKAQNAGLGEVRTRAEANSRRLDERGARFDSIERRLDNIERRGGRR